MTQVLKNKKGVTLVELLAVIVIMGIIAAIAVPAIGGLIKNSEEKAIVGTLTTVEEAARLYASVTENDSTSRQVSFLDDEDYVDLTGYTFTGLTFTVSNGSVVWSYGTPMTVETSDGIFVVTGSAGNWTVNKS